MSDLSDLFAVLWVRPDDLQWAHKVFPEKSFPEEEIDAIYHEVQWNAQRRQLDSRMEVRPHHMGGWFSLLIFTLDLHWSSPPRQPRRPRSVKAAPRGPPQIPAALSCQEPRS